MKIEFKPVITFTDEEYAIFNQACCMLDEIVNGEHPRPVVKDDEGRPLDLEELFNHFANFVNWVQDNQE